LLQAPMAHVAWKLLSSGGGLAGFCILILGLACSLVGTIIVAKVKLSYIQNVKDMLFIDSTTGTSFFGPLGEAVSDHSKFLDFKRSTREKYEHCLQEDGHTADDCAPFSYELIITVFNVTNPLAVVLGQERPLLQELGPVWLAASTDIFNVSEDLWNSQQVARYQTADTLQLHPKCDEQCKALLDTEIVIPNLCWAGMLETPGLQVSVLYTATVMGILKKVPPASWTTIGKTIFGLESDQESVAFGEAFCTGDTLKTQEAMNVFLSTTSEAAGNPRAKCALGSMQLESSKCESLVTVFELMLPMTIEALKDYYRSQYGVGDALPIFIKRKVRDVIGWGPTSGFEDPILGPSSKASYSVASSGSLSGFVEVYVGSKYGIKGFGIEKKHDDLAYDCRVDPDCMLSNTSQYDSCNASETCTPQYFGGYARNQFPARLWGSDLYSNDSAIGALLPLSLAGSFLTVQVVQSLNLQLEHNGEVLGLEYMDADLYTLPRRLESCGSSTLLDSPGYDCNGPPSTTWAGYISNVPVYESLPLFHEGMAFNHTATNQGQLSEPYVAEQKVEFLRCAGSDWCDDQSKYNFTLQFEPETGMIFKQEISLQTNLRIGHRKSLFFPNMSDLLVPVLISTISASAPLPSQFELAKLQNGPAIYDATAFFLKFVGIMCLGFGGCCFGSCSIIAVWAWGFCERRLCDTALKQCDAHVARATVDSEEPRN
jgi:hypothetical protein